MKNTPAKNAIWIISGKIIQSLLGLVVSMLSARYLGPSNYGLINYAASVVAFVIPVMQLGFRSTLVQEFVEYPDQEGETLGTALLLNVLSSLACIVGVIAFVRIANPHETTTYLVCFLYSLNLIFQALEMIQYWFQAKLMAQYIATASLFAYIFVSAYKIYLLFSAKSVYWFAVSQVLDYLVIAAILTFVYYRLGGPPMTFSWKCAKRMFLRSRHYIISAMMVTIFQQTDRLMLKMMMDDAATGYYSAAVSCAGLSSFVFGAIIDSMRPVILEAKRSSNADFVVQMRRLYAIIFYLSLLQCLFMTIFASPIIWILFGAEYAPAVPALMVGVWYVTYSYFGAVRNVWILAEGKQKYLWIINLCGATMNVILNLMLIPLCGLIGAAIASLVTQFFANFLLGFIVKPIRDCNRIMLQSMHPCCALQMARELIQMKRS